MDYDLLVDERIEDGKAFLAELARQNFDVSVAFWVITDEEGLSFYIGSTDVGAMGLDGAYRVVIAALIRIHAAQYLILTVKPIDANDPIALAAAEVRDRHPARLATRYRGKRLGPLAIDEAYIYPRAGVMSRKEVLQTVTDLMDRAGALAPSVVTLRDGSQIQAIPVGLQMNGPGVIQVLFHDLKTDVNRSIAVDDVVGIL